MSTDLSTPAIQRITRTHLRDQLNRVRAAHASEMLVNTGHLRLVLDLLDAADAAAPNAVIVQSGDWGTHDVQPSPTGKGRWCARCGVAETTCSLEGNVCRPLYAGALPYGRQPPNIVFPSGGYLGGYQVHAVAPHAAAPAVPGPGYRVMSAGLSADQGLVPVLQKDLQKDPKSPPPAEDLAGQGEPVADIALIRQAAAAGRFRIRSKERSEGADPDAGMVWPIEIELPCINGLSCWFAIGNLYTPDAAAQGYTDGALSDDLARALAAHIMGSLFAAPAPSRPADREEIEIQTADHIAALAVSSEDVGRELNLAEVLEAGFRRFGYAHPAEAAREACETIAAGPLPPISQAATEGRR